MILLAILDTLDPPERLFSLDQGDWAWLKRLPYGTFSNINPKTSNVFELVGRNANTSMLVKEIIMVLRPDTSACSHR